jgi:hypothetical protein
MTEADFGHATPSGTRALRGSIKWLKIWNATLTEAEISAEMNVRSAVRATNLYGVYYLETATDTTDRSGNGNNLTVGGTPTTDADFGPAPPALSGRTTIYLDAQS